MAQSSLNIRGNVMKSSFNYSSNTYKNQNTLKSASKWKTTCQKWHRTSKTPQKLSRSTVKRSPMKRYQFSTGSIIRVERLSKGPSTFSERKAKRLFFATAIQGMYNIVMFLKTPRDDGYSDVLKHNKRVRLILLKGGL